jgi:hypothetical protein
MRRKRHFILTLRNDDTSFTALFLSRCRFAGNRTHRQRRARAPDTPLTLGPQTMIWEDAAVGAIGKRQYRSGGSSGGYFCWPLLILLANGRDVSRVFDFAFELQRSGNRRYSDRRITAAEVYIGTADSLIGGGGILLGILLGHLRSVELDLLGTLHD